MIRQVAQNIANYSIDNGVTINDIELVSDDPKAVSISTSSLSSGTDYTLTISNVTDVAPIPNVIADNSTVVVSNTAPACQITFDEPLSAAWSYMINCEDGSGSVTIDDNINQLVVDASSGGCNTFYDDRDYWNGIISTPVSGDFEVYVQVMIPDGGETGSRGGLILGRNLSPGGPGIAAAVARAFKGEFRYYYDSDGDGLMDDWFKPGGHSDTTWLRMVRMGNTITSYYSNETEPLGWQELGSYDVGYGDQDLQISLAAAEMLMHFDNLYLSTCPTGDAGDKNHQTFHLILFLTNIQLMIRLLSATATSGLDVSFSVVSGPASVSGDVVTLTGSTET